MERQVMSLGSNRIREEVSERFVNPYNFIPLAEKCNREDSKGKEYNREEQNCYTGYFECSMRLLTPLFIPNTSSSVRLLQVEEAQEGEENNKKYAGYDFFSYEDYSKAEPYTGEMPSPPSDPVIPGSEIRGAVRSVFEAAFNGCMSSVEGDRELSRRSAEIKKPDIPNKNKNQNKSKHVYRGPKCIGREIFKKKIESLLENNGGYQSCSNEYLCPACQIFGMMGKSEKTETYAYGSKVRITDATLIHPVKNSADLFEKPVVLPEMGEPRPSTTEFYTESPYDPGETKNKQNYWTYDYKYVKEKEGAKKGKKRVYLDDTQPKIRGRKYYWHKDVEMNEFKNNKVSAMQQRIRPLKPSRKSDHNPTFQFRVYFEQLNKKQLEQLKWSLDFGNPDCAHKIGRGKPLGFGSVQISVESLCTREIDEETGRWELLTVGDNDNNEVRYEEFFVESGFSSENIPEELKIMSNWKDRPSNVSYPLGQDEGNRDKVNAKASHQWFRLNRMEKKQEDNSNDALGNNYNHNFSKVLPTVAEDADKGLDQKKALYKLVKKKQSS